MTVLRISKREKNFLVLDKTCLYQPSLSWAAKGLHTYLMSLPADWRVKVSDLKNRATDGRDSVRSLLTKLEQAGYLSKEWVRDEQTGKFLCLEYVVHELPQVKEAPQPCPGKPETGNPSSEKPGPQKPTLINNKITKDTSNKEIITAAKRVLNQPTTDKAPKKAAAVFPQREVSSSFLPIDSFIGDRLTSNQKARVDALVQKIEPCIERRENLVNEIYYCLLSSHHFTSCRQDFAKKLNAIRTVILRGDWQTPVGMVIHEKEEEVSILKQFEQELQEAQAEVNHFRRLIAGANAQTKCHFEEIIAKAGFKIDQIEEKRRKFYSRNQQEKEIACYY